MKTILAVMFGFITVSAIYFKDYDCLGVAICLILIATLDELKERE